MMSRDDSEERKMAAREEAMRSRHSGGRARPTSMMETNFAETTLRAFAARLQLNKSNKTTGSLRRLGETQPGGRKQKQKKLSLEVVPSPSPTASPQGSRHLLQTAGVTETAWGEGGYGASLRAYRTSRRVRTTYSPAFYNVSFR